MAKSRSSLQAKLKAITANVYFQPPENLKVVYPCIVYELDTYDTQYADNVPHRVDKRYTVTVMDRDPDSDIPDKVSLLPLCSHNRYFIADNLNHNVFTLYH